MLPGPVPVPDAVLALLRPSESVVRQDRQTAQVPGGLTVTFEESETDQETGRVVFRGRVEAVYDQTRVQCDELTVDSFDRRGEAKGGVRVVDPEGEISAQSLTFDWGAKTGVAFGAVLQAPNVWIAAERLDVAPGLWTVTRGRGSLSRTGDTPVTFEADSAEIVPGQRALLRNVYFKVFGTRLGPIPRIPFSLDRRVAGLKAPEIANRKGVGLGVSWRSGFRVGSGGVTDFAVESFPKRLPGLALQYAYSPLDPDSPTAIAPRGDLDERFADGWFDNVSVASPASEEADIGARRSSFGVATGWNRGTTARPEDSTEVSKALELSMEQGGRRGGMAWRGAVRLQSQRDGANQGFLGRTVAELTVLPRPVPVGRGLYLRARGDLFGTASGSGLYGWARGQVGVFAEPVEGVTLGAAYQMGTGRGRPDFRFDPLVGGDAVHLRVDYVRGPFTARYLRKYDLGRNTWYDQEYELAVVAGAFQPFLVFREFPSETRIGVRFRIDSFRDRVSSRQQRR